MSHQLPTIRIKDAWLLRWNASIPLNELWGEGEPLRSDEEYTQIVEAYKKGWRPIEKKVLNGACETLDLDFRQGLIDVYIAPWFNAFSDPMVIGTTQEPDVFIDLLTHELIHKLLTDNTAVPDDAELFEPWQKLFGDDHTFDALVHIPVHATLQAIYLDVLKEPRRFERDIKRSKENKSDAYTKAWDYVQEKGYKEIIDQLKSSYKELSAKYENS